MKSSLFLSAAWVAALFGCARASPDPAPAPETTTPRVRVVTETVTVRDPDAERRLAELQLQLLDKETQIDELQARLDEAQRDVVRSLAKVQTLATRAEAASGLAEAEVALETLRRTMGGRAPAVTRAAELLREATDAFNQQNYGGALWLANQAKNRAVAGRGRLEGAAALEMLEGERPFEIPIRFETTVRSNLRAGPGTTFETLITLDAATPLTGYSYLDQWVHVTDNANRKGWIFFPLLRRRSGQTN